MCWEREARFLVLFLTDFCWGGGEECVLVELSAKVEQGLAEGLFVCDLERR